MATMLDVGGITSELGKYGRELSPATFAIGFIYGATRDVPPAPGPFQAQISQRLTDTIKRVTGQNIKIGAQTSGLTQKFVPFNIINSATGAAVGLHLAYEMTHNRWVKLAKDIFQAPLLGYGVGEMFDDAVGTAGGLAGNYAGNYPVANYNAQARNGLPVGTGAPWTG